MDTELNLLYHVSDYEITEETQETVFEFLKNLGYHIDNIELHNISKLYWNDEVNDFETCIWNELRIYTTDEISVENACKLWDNDILDVEGSLTFVNSNGNLVWRES
jgi:hypothetical protein